MHRFWLRRAVLRLVGQHGAEQLLHGHDVTAGAPNDVGLKRMATARPAAIVEANSIVIVAAVEGCGYARELDAFRLLRVTMGLLDFPDHTRVHRVHCSFSGVQTPSGETPPNDQSVATVPEKQNSTSRKSVRCWPHRSQSGNSTGSSEIALPKCHRRLRCRTTIKEVLAGECTNGDERMLAPKVPVRGSS